MRRRAFLAVLGTGVGAGCVSGSEGDEPGTVTTTDGAGKTDSTAPDRDGLTNGWAIDEYDAGRTGYNSATRLPAEAAATWSAGSVEDDASWATAPVIDDRRVYVGYAVERTRVTAYGAMDGTRAWEASLREDERPSGLVVYEGTVVLATRIDRQGRSRLVGLSVGDGSLQWKVTLPARLTGPPLVANGRLYAAIGGDDSAVLAYATDGTEQWRRAIDGEAYTPLCFEAGVLFVGTANGDIVALDASDGELLWAAEVVAGDTCCPDIQGTPAVADGQLYVPGIDERLYAAATDDGSAEWTAELLEDDYGNPVPSPAVADETVYVNTIHGGVIALDSADGSERWRTDEHGGNLPPAAGGDGVVCPRTDASVAAYDESGEERWRFEMHRPDAPGDTMYIMDPEVAVAHDRAYVTVNDGRTYAIGSPSP